MQGKNNSYLRNCIIFAFRFHIIAGTRDNYYPNGQRHGGVYRITVSGNDYLIFVL